MISKVLKRLLIDLTCSSTDDWLSDLCIEFLPIQLIKDSTHLPNTKFANILALQGGFKIKLIFPAKPAWTVNVVRD